MTSMSRSCDFRTTSEHRARKPKRTQLFRIEAASANSRLENLVSKIIQKKLAKTSQMASNSCKFQAVLENRAEEPETRQIIQD